MPPIRELIAGLRSAEPDRWYAAGAEAGPISRSKTAIRSVCRILRDGPDERQRWQAAYILGRATANQEAARTLLECLENEGETAHVRSAAAEQLTYHEAAVGRRRLIELYGRGLDDPSPEFRFWCLYGLARLNARSWGSRIQQLAATDEAIGWAGSKVATEAKWALACFDGLPDARRLAPGPFSKPGPIATPTHTGFVRRAIAIAAQNVRDNLGGPFGAVIVRGREIVSEGANRVVLQHDPTAHAEIAAIREACRVLQTFDLSGCDIYCSAEPNPMCLGAIYWARLGRIYYAASREDSARAGFNDLMLYRETSLPIAERSIPTRNLARRAGRAPFQAWDRYAGKIRY